MCRALCEHIGETVMRLPSVWLQRHLGNREVREGLMNASPDPNPHPVAEADATERKSSRSSNSKYSAEMN